MTIENISWSSPQKNVTDHCTIISWIPSPADLNLGPWCPKSGVLTSRPPGHFWNAIQVHWEGSNLMLSTLGGVRGVGGGRGWKSADDNLKYLSYFSQKIGFYIACKLSQGMKFQSLFSGKIRKISSICLPLTLPRDRGKIWVRTFCLLTLVLLNPDIPCLCKQCRSRSVGFWRSQLIWICTVCH